jgi:hypothetical protein
VGLVLSGLRNLWCAVDRSGRRVCGRASRVDEWFWAVDLGTIDGGTSREYRYQFRPRPYR